MIPISDETKKVYENDVVPGFITILIGDQLYPAETLYPAEDLYPKGGQFDENGWVEGSLSITEALCSAETLDYKRVEANKMEVKLASEEGNKNEFNGLAVQVSQTVNAEVIPLGSFTVSSTEREGDYYTKITAYDDMKKFIDTDVTDWWNTGVTFPITIKNLLLSLCKQVGVEQALPDSWTNSDVDIKQNTYADSVKGSDILGMIQDACGLFFHTNRKNQLVVITGAADETEFKHTAIYEDPTIAEYTIPGITGVQIKSTDDDIGTLYGEKTTVYQVTGNYLLLDKTDEERKTIAKGILANIGGKPYKPFSAKVKARNYVECGDPIKITTYNGNTSSFMLLSRTMTEQGLITDEIEVKGKANIVNNPRSNSKKIETLNKRAHEIIETLNEYSSRFTNLETEQTEQGKKITETQSQIKQTADEINLSVSKSITETKAYADSAASAAESSAKSDTADKLKSYSTTTEMNSAITAKADEINLSVSKTYTSKDDLGNTLTSYTKKAEIIADINGDTSEVKISADKIEFNGSATFNTAVESATSSMGYTTDFDLTRATADMVTGYMLKTKGQTIINGDNITTGTINCNLLNGGVIKGQVIQGGTITGTTMKTTKLTFGDGTNDVTVQDADGSTKHKAGIMLGGAGDLYINTDVIKYVNYTLPDSYYTMISAYDTTVIYAYSPDGQSSGSAHMSVTAYSPTHYDFGMIGALTNASYWAYVGGGIDSDNPSGSTVELRLTVADQTVGFELNSGTTARLYVGETAVSSEVNRIYINRTTSAFYSQSGKQEFEITDDKIGILQSSNDKKTWKYIFWATYEDGGYHIADWNNNTSIWSDGSEMYIKAKDTNNNYSGYRVRWVWLDNHWVLCAN